MNKQLVVIGTAVMTTLLALLMLWQFRLVVVYVLISLALAAMVRPLVKGLTSRGLVVRLALILLFLVAIAGFGFLIFAASGRAVSEIQLLAHSVSIQNEWIMPIWLKGSSFQQSLVDRLPLPSELFNAATGSEGQLVLPAIIGLTRSIGTVMSGAAVILFLSLYWIINQIHFERLWLSLLPTGLRRQARDIWRTIEIDLGAYMRSELLQSLVAGLLLGLGYWALGSPYPVLLALIGALAWLIPVVGAALAVILPLVIGLQTGVQLSLLTALYTLVVLIVLQVWVEPRLFRRRWDNPILTLVILIALADAFGLLGVLVAPPLSAACLILWNLLVSHRLASGAAAQVSDLKERQERIWATIKAMEEPPSRLVSSSMERLTRLIEKAEPLLQTSLPAKGLPGEPAEPLHSPQPYSAEGEPAGSIKA
jgi:predicted PurR-regulated permease PerM